MKSTSAFTARNTFGTLFKRLRLQAGIATLKEFGNLMSHKGHIYEDSTFSHWQRNTKLPKQRKTILAVLAVLREKNSQLTLKDSNDLLRGAGQGYLTEPERAALHLDSAGPLEACGEPDLRADQDESTITVSASALPGQFLACLATVGHPDNTISAEHYVPARARLFVDLENDPVHLDNLFQRWLHDVDSRHLLLLGEYGVGKTSACLYLYRKLAIEYLKRPTSEVFPIYIALDVFAKSKPSASSLTELLRHSLGSVVVPGGHVLPSESQRLYILDGLDEMATSATIASIRTNLELLRPFLDSGSQAVLACRTH